MNIRLEKCVRILNDLVGYCHDRGASQYHMSLRHKYGVGYMSIRAQIDSISEETLRTLSDELRVPRQREIEQNYWGLSGSADTNEDVALLGMLTDHAEVEYKDGFLHIQMWRHD